MSIVKNKKTLPEDRRRSLKENAREMFIQMKDLEFIPKTVGKKIFFF